MTEFCKLQVANSADKPRFKANSSKRIISTQTSVRS